VKIEVSRVVGPAADGRGLCWITGTGRRWIFPRFGIKLGNRWIFPVGTGRKPNIGPESQVYRARSG